MYLLCVLFIDEFERVHCPSFRDRAKCVLKISSEDKRSAFCSNLLGRHTILSRAGARVKAKDLVFCLG